MSVFSCRPAIVCIGILALSVGAEEVAVTPECVPPASEVVIAVEESGWSVGGGTPVAEAGNDWDVTVADDGIVAVPFSLPGNALTLTGASVRYLGRVPGSLCQSSGLLAVPGFACAVAVELPTGVAGGILQAVGNGLVTVGRGFSDGVETMLGGNR